MKLEKSVNKVLDWCIDEVGKFQGDTFGVNSYDEFHSFEIKSPIEQILYLSLKAIMVFNFYEREQEKACYIEGLEISPQKKIDNYRVDFYVCNYHWNEVKKEQFKKDVIVECDSQQFHERTETERRYEKRRDRYFQSKGYKIFHYTGSEIIVNHQKIAAEIIAYVTNQKIEDMQIDSNFGD